MASLGSGPGAIKRRAPLTEAACFPHARRKVQEPANAPAGNESGMAARLSIAGGRRHPVAHEGGDCSAALSASVRTDPRQVLKTPHNGHDRWRFVARARGRDAGQCPGFDSGGCKGGGCHAGILKRRPGSEPRRQTWLILRLHGTRRLQRDPVPRFPSPNSRRLSSWPGKREVRRESMSGLDGPTGNDNCRPRACGGA